MGTVIGVISDTHWPTRVPAIQWEAIEAAFSGVSLIFHAGDIETPDVLDRRGKVAKLFGIKTDPWNGMFADLLCWFADDMPDAIVFGHWHRVYSGVYEGVLLFNPGAVYAPTPDMFRWQLRCNPPPVRRLELLYRLRKAESQSSERWPVPTVGLLTIADDGALSTQIIELPRVVTRV